MIVASSERAAPALYQDLPREGIEVTAHYQAWLDAWVPVEKLPLLADMPGVTYVKAQIPVMPMEGRGD